VATALHAFLGVRLQPDDACELGVINASKKTEPLDEATRLALTAKYAEPNRQLARLLGPDFHVWT
jgi:hypothetical protein